MPERHFTEQQVAAIIRKAAEVQSQKARTSGIPSGGISLSEVRRIAQELGIEGSALESALSEAAVWNSNDSGGPRSLSRTLERTIDGSLSDEDYAVVMEEFVPTSSPGGTAITVGKTVNYNAMAGLAQCNVHLSERNGRTTLRVKSDAWLSALPSFLPVFILSVVSGAIIFEETNFPSDVKFQVFLITVICLISLAFFLFKSFVGYSNKKISMLTDNCAKRLSERTTDVADRTVGDQKETTSEHQLRQQG